MHTIPNSGPNILTVSNQLLAFEELKKQAKILYDEVGSIYCPALKSEIIFNADGFHHLRYNNSRSERSKHEQKNKLNFLREAVNIIKNTTTVQEYRELLEPVGKRAADGFRKTKNVAYYGFWAVIEKNNKKTRIKVVIRRVGDGQYNFWSIMPFWTEKRVNGMLLKIFGSNNIANE